MNCRFLRGCCLCAVIVPVETARAQTGATLRDPLPLAAAASWRTHNGRAPIDLSPDGLWVAHTVHSADTVARDTRMYTATGAPLAEGNSRREATLTHARTGEVVRIGGATCSSWGPVWSPDASRVVFYSDEGGEAGLWVWESATRRATRIEGVIVRPAFGFELPRWSADSSRLVVKLLPEGMSIAEANALGEQRPTRSNPPANDPTAPTVTVRRVEPRPASAAEVAETRDDPTVQRPPTHDVTPFVADLAVVEVESRSVRRVVKLMPVRDYAFSPGGRHIACTILKGWEPNTQQANYDLVLLDLATGAARTLATNLRLGYGIEWSFSPDGRSIAYIPSGQQARRVVSEQASDERMVLLSMPDGAVISLRSDDAPTFDPGDGEHAPIWDAAGENLYALGDGALWRVSVDTGEVRRLAGIPDWRIRSIVTRSETNTLWTTDEGRTSWALAREDGGARSAIVAIETATGAPEMVLAEDAVYGGIFNVDAAGATGEVAFVSSDVQHLAGVRLFDSNSREARYAPALNPELDRFELGRSTIIEWLSLDGDPLRGALLLPPGEHTRPLPLVVWVYGGSYGSQAVNRFGLAGTDAVFNMHVLATRGYAVLFPDAPIRTGRATQDLMSAVMPGVNAAIKQGYADPERMAIMGQSYGAHNVLCILTQTPRFNAAVVTAAVTHPDLFAAYLSGSTGYYETGQGNMGGTIWDYPERYHRNSPLFQFNQIQTPLLIGQGEKDGNLVASETIFRALERLEKPVEYRVYGGEGHVITTPANVVDFWERRLEFLAEHLDLSVDEMGRVSPD